MANIRRSLALTLLQQYGCAAIAFVSIVILARLLTPTEVGIYSVSAAVVGIAHMLRDFGVGRYLIQEPDLTTDRLRTAFGIGIATAWTLAAALFLGRGYIAEFYGDERLRDVVTVLAGNFLLIPFGAPILWVLTREMRFGQLLLINVSSQVVQSVTSIALAMSGFSYMSLAWASLAGALTTTLLASLLDLRHLFVVPSFKAWRRILGFGLWASGQSLISEAGNSATDLILGRTLGFGAVAIYSRAQGLIFTIYRDILKAANIVALPAFAEGHRQGANLRQPYLRGTSYLIVLTWPVIALFALTAYPLINFLFGHNWIAAAPILQILCVSVAFAPVVTLANQILLALGQVKPIFRIALVVQIARVLVILVGSLFGLQMVAALQVVPSAISTFLWLRRLHFAAGIEARALIRPCLQGVGVVMLAGIGPLAVALTARDTSDFVVLALSGVLWGLGWLAGIFAVRHPICEEVQRMLAMVFGAVSVVWAKRR